MGSAILKFATWNIGGGILGESHQQDGRPSLDYHISILKEYSPDVVCFQEAHDYQGRREGQAEYIASQSGYPHVATFPISESHMEKGASLTLAVLSRFQIRDTRYRQFANPGLKGTGPNGEEWKLFDKGYAIGVIDVEGRSIGVVNAHCFPLHYFGASAVEPRFAPMWSSLVRDLLSVRKQHPTLVAIDLLRAGTGCTYGSCAARCLYECIRGYTHYTEGHAAGLYSLRSRNATARNYRQTYGI